MLTRSRKKKPEEPINDVITKASKFEPTITILIFAHGTELPRTPLITDMDIETFSLAGTLGLPSVFSNTLNHKMSKQYIYSWLLQIFRNSPTIEERATKFNDFKEIMRTRYKEYIERECPYFADPRFGLSRVSNVDSEHCSFINQNNNKIYSFMPQQTDCTKDGLDCNVPFFGIYVLNIENTNDEIPQSTFLGQNRVEFDIWKELFPSFASTNSFSDFNNANGIFSNYDESNPAQGNFVEMSSEEGESKEGESKGGEVLTSIKLNKLLELFYNAGFRKIKIIDTSCRFLECELEEMKAGKRKRKTKKRKLIQKKRKTKKQKHKRKIKRI